MLDSETVSSGAPSGGRAHRKRARVDVESLTLMEGEGNSLKILGFNQRERAEFVQILMRFGVGKLDWAEFVPRLTQKTYDEINNYAQLFFSHLFEDVNDSPTFSDGVPKEGLRVQDVRDRIGVSVWVEDKDDMGHPDVDTGEPANAGEGLVDNLSEMITAEVHLNVYDTDSRRLELVDCETGGESDRQNDDQGLDLEVMNNEDSHNPFDERLNNLDSSSLSYGSDDQSDGQSDDLLSFSSSSESDDQSDELLSFSSSHGSDDESDGQSDDLGDLIKSASISKSLEQGQSEFDSPLLDKGSDIQNDDPIESLSSVESENAELRDLIKSAPISKSLEQGLSEFNPSSLDKGSDIQNDDPTECQNDDPVECLSNVENDSDLTKSSWTDKTLQERALNSSLLDYGSNENSDDLIKAALINNASTGKTLDQTSNVLNAPLLSFGSDESNYLGDVINPASPGTTDEQGHNELNSSRMNDGSGDDGSGDDDDDGDDDTDTETESSTDDDSTDTEDSDFDADWDSDFLGDFYHNHYYSGCDESDDE